MIAAWTTWGEPDSVSVKDEVGWKTEKPNELLRLFCRTDGVCRKEGDIFVDE